MWEDIDWQSFSIERKSSIIVVRGFRTAKGTYIPYPFWHQFVIHDVAFLDFTSYRFLLCHLTLKGAYSRKFQRVRRKRIRGRKVRIF